MKKVVLITVALLIGAVAFGQIVDTDPEQPSRLWQIISGVLLVASMFFASALAKVRAKITDAMFLVKEAVQLVEVVLAASADGTFTPDEQARIKKEAEDVKAAWKRLLGKK